MSAGVNPNWHWHASKRQREMIARGHRGPKQPKAASKPVERMNLQELFTHYCGPAK